MGNDGDAVADEPWPAATAGGGVCGSVAAAGAGRHLRLRRLRRPAAGCGGAEQRRRPLGGHWWKTDGIELRAECPVSMRRPEERGTLGSVVKTILVPLFIGLTDPVAPDAWFYADCLQASFAKLRQAAEDTRAAGLRSSAPAPRA